MSESAYAASPFDHAKADIILRSSDNIDFRIFKLFLSLASPFFESLFDIPQPIEESEEQEIKDGLPIIPVSEDSKTLDALLRSAAIRAGTDHRGCRWRGCAAVRRWQVRYSRRVLSTIGLCCNTSFQASLSSNARGGWCDQRRRSIHR
ncbi:hypothetical protein HYDPIDRAFT_130726 [Hydnomerulius pinastri MD-312]|nr:hypothetical protein HYDPIDRAFT_130726 [Hydnomerulius pinastri MD-312]